MRPITKFAFVPMLCFVAVPAAAAPALAPNVLDAAPIEFASGTGTSEMSAAPILSLADAPAGEESSAQDMERMAEAMADPKMQDSVANMVEGMTNMMMHLPVGKFAEAIEKARPGSMKKRIRSDATVADLAGRAGKNLPEKLGKESRAMMAMMGGFTKAFASMLPELEKMGEEMEEGFKKASKEAN